MLITMAEESGVDTELGGADDPDVAPNVVANRKGVEEWDESEQGVNADKEKRKPEKMVSIVSRDAHGGMRVHTYEAGALIN